MEASASTKATAAMEATQTTHQMHTPKTLQVNTEKTDHTSTYTGENERKHNLRAHSEDQALKSTKEVNYTTDLFQKTMTYI